MKEYNGWILLEINRLKSIEEALSLKQKIVEYPQTLFAMIGSRTGGKKVRHLKAYCSRPGSLWSAIPDAEVFHAHAYRHALKTYEPRLSYPIELKRPVLEMGCRLSYDADVYYSPDALSIHLEQPVAMPDESAYQERFEKRVPVPVESAGQTLYDQYRYVAIQYEVALQRALEEHGSLSIGIGFQTFVGHSWKTLFRGWGRRGGLCEVDDALSGESDLGSGDPGDLEAVVSVSLRFGLWLYVPLQAGATTELENGGVYEPSLRFLVQSDVRRTGISGEKHVLF